MHTSPLQALTKIVLSEAVLTAINKGLEVVDKRLESLVRVMKKEKEDDRAVAAGEEQEL